VLLIDQAEALLDLLAGRDADIDDDLHARIVSATTVAVTNLVSALLAPSGCSASRP
jgi:glycerol-3-phosphate O-acyltransferase